MPPIILQRCKQVRNNCVLDFVTQSAVMHASESRKPALLLHFDPLSATSDLTGSEFSKFSNLRCLIMHQVQQISGKCRNRLLLKFYFRLSIARFLPNIFAFICRRKIQCLETELIDLDHLWVRVHQVPGKCFRRRES